MASSLRNALQSSPIGCFRAPQLQSKKALKQAVRIQCCSAKTGSTSEPTVAGVLSRRSLLGVAGGVVTSFAVPSTSFAAKGPKGFNSVQDRGDGYEFLYPFGWQEVPVQGADVVYKDIIEPLESVSVQFINTDKQDVTEFGEVQEVAQTLAEKVLSSPNQTVTVKGAALREQEGHKYYEFEFTASNPRYTRHSLAVVTVANGRFYTLTTGANEKRWGKMENQLKTVVRSFQILEGSTADALLS